MITIRVDFNSLVQDGLVRASLRRADGDVAVGDRVRTVDPGEERDFFAIVRSIDRDRGRVYLQMEWEPVTNMVTLESTSPSIQTAATSWASVFSSWHAHRREAIHLPPIAV